VKRTAVAAVLLLLAGAPLLAGCTEEADVNETDVNEAAVDTDEADDVGASIQCRDSMREAADEPDPDAADPLIFATLSACSNADEWLAALREYPAAFGLTERAEIGALELQLACSYSDPATPETSVCVDAVNRGLIPAP